MKSLLSIVIPCFNEEEVIGETIDRLLYFCNKIENINIELIFVDDLANAIVYFLNKKTKKKLTRSHLSDFGSYCLGERGGYSLCLSGILGARKPKNGI